MELIDFNEILDKTTINILESSEKKDCKDSEIKILELQQINKITDIDKNFDEIVLKIKKNNENNNVMSKELNKLFDDVNKIEDSINLRISIHENNIKKLKLLLNQYQKYILLLTKS